MTAPIFPTSRRIASLSSVALVRMFNETYFVRYESSRSVELFPRLARQKGTLPRYPNIHQSDENDESLSHRARCFRRSTERKAFAKLVVFEMHTLGRHAILDRKWQPLSLSLSFSFACRGRDIFQFPGDAYEAWGFTRIRGCQRGKSICDLELGLGKRIQAGESREDRKGEWRERSGGREREKLYARVGKKKNL